MYLNKYPKRKLLLFTGDILLIIISFSLAFLWRYERAGVALGLNEGLNGISFLLLFYLISFYIFNLYDIRLEFKTIQNLILILTSFLFAALPALMVLQIYPDSRWREIFLVDLVLTFTLITGWRLTYSLVFKLTIPQRNILILGTEKLAAAVRHILNPYPEYRVMAVIDDCFNEHDPSEGNPDFALEEIIDQFDIDDVIVTRHPVQNSSLKDALLKWKMKGGNIYDMLTLYETFLYKVPASYMKERWIFDNLGSESLHRKVYNRLKRILDILISLTTIIILFPLGIMLSLVIKLSSKGPVFFVQNRIGRNHKPFPMIKFRTMVTGAEEKGPQWADKEDPRVTVVGRFLRKTRLDEMPQFLNVLKGDMSIVGPRPERNYFIKELEKKLPFYSLRFSVKPGLTGWAQVYYGYAASEQEGGEKWEYDLYYIKNMSGFLDLKILLKTIYIIIFGKGR